jgi:hypothetical protein
MPAEGLAQRLALCAALVVEVPLRLAVVEPEAGRVSTKAGRGVAMPNQRHAAALDEGFPGFSVPSLARAAVMRSEMASAASENPTRRPNHHDIDGNLKRARIDVKLMKGRGCCPRSRRCQGIETQVHSREQRETHDNPERRILE